MQKVEGSSPFIRSSEGPGNGAFLLTMVSKMQKLTPRRVVWGLTAAIALVASDGVDVARRVSASRSELPSRVSP